MSNVIKLVLSVLVRVDGRKRSDLNRRSAGSRSSEWQSHRKLIGYMTWDIDFAKTYSAMWNILWLFLKYNRRVLKSVTSYKVLRSRFGFRVVISFIFWGFSIRFWTIDTLYPVWLKFAVFIGGRSCMFTCYDGSRRQQRKQGGRCMQSCIAYVASQHGRVS